MKRNLMLTLAALITSLYTMVVLFSFDGLSRGGLFEIIIRNIPFLKVSYFLITLIFICIAINIIVTFSISGRNGYTNRTLKALFISLLLGILIFIICIKVDVLSRAIYDGYISLFYHGNNYEGEEKLQQVMSFIIRLLLLCFVLSGISTWVYLRLNKRAPLPENK